MRISVIALLPQLLSVAVAWPVVDWPLLRRQTGNNYGPDLRERDNSDWMKSVTGTTKLTDINMPGTHDTMTYNIKDDPLVSPFFKCQRADLDGQLKAGTRFFDIRCHQKHDKFEIWHSIMPTGTNFEQVMKAFDKFLAAHPSETILMRVRNENDFDGDKTTNKKTFEQVYNLYETDANYKTSTIFTNRKYRGPYNAWPTLDAARGKILVFPDWSSSNLKNIGFPWNDKGLFDIEDTYNIKVSVNEKWTPLKNHLNACRGGLSDKMCISFSSASQEFKLWPPPKMNPLTVAVREKVYGKWNGINHALFETIKTMNGRWGIVAMDFPGIDLVEAVKARR